MLSVKRKTQKSGGNMFINYETEYKDSNRGNPSIIYDEDRKRIE